MIHCQPGFATVLFFLFFLSAKSLPASPNPRTNDNIRLSFTNHAGHVITGKPLFVTNGTVRMQSAKNTFRDIPLTAFPQSERERIQFTCGDAVPPPPIAEIVEELRYRTSRIDAMEKAGIKTAEGAAARRREELANAREMIETRRKAGLVSDAAAAYFTALHCPETDAEAK